MPTETIEPLKPPPFLMEEVPDPADVKVSPPEPVPDLAAGRVNRNAAAVIGEELTAGEPMAIPRWHHPKLSAAQVKFKLKIRELRLSLGLSQTRFGVFLGCPSKNARITIARWESLRNSTLPRNDRIRELRRRIQWLKRTVNEEEFQFDRLEQADFSK